MSDNATTKKAGTGTTRRPFLVRFLAVLCSGLVAMFPVAAGLGVIFDPARRRKTSAAGESSATNAANSAPTSNIELVRVCSLDALTPGGPPKSFPVILKVVDDAWTRTLNQRVGMVFLERAQAGVKPEVVAFNAACPHLGCFVDFNTTTSDFECPCHLSAFAKDGKFIFGPSRRGLDELEVKLDTNGEQTDVLVAFQNFESGIAERKPIE